jgi:predicted alpha/beta-fold hydrolase
VEQVPVRVPLPGGGVLVAEWLRVSQPGPAVVVVHGAGGSSESPYAVRTARAFARRGFHVLRVNLRGSGLGAGQANEVYHGGLTDDLELYRAFLEQQPEVTRIGWIGFSLGGHALLRWAGRWGDDVPASTLGVVAVSAPLDLAAAAAAFREGRRSIYEAFMMRGLVNNARALVRRAPHRLLFDERDLSRMKIVQEFDGTVVASLWGFQSAEDYYRRASCVSLLHRVRAPTLCVYAKDDPFVSYEASVTDAMERASDAVRFQITEHGGHVGFTERFRDLRGDSFAAREAASFFDELLASEEREILLP